MLALLAAVVTYGSGEWSNQPPRRFRGDASAQVRFVNPDLISKACEDLMQKKPPSGRFWAGCVMFGFRRADTVEPVPKGYENLPLAPGWQEVMEPTVADVDRLCRGLGANAHDDYNRRLVASCAQGPTHTIYLPASMDADWLSVARDHERLHALGAIHPQNARGWGNLPSLDAVNAIRAGLFGGQYATGSRP